MRTHTSEKPNNCEICKKSFKCKSSLYIHKRTHTGEKPYKCKICYKTFAQSGGLSSHMQTKHMRAHTDKEPFNCERTYRGHLIKHRTIHTRENPDSSIKESPLSTKVGIEIEKIETIEEKVEESLKQEDHAESVVKS